MQIAKRRELGSLCLMFAMVHACNALYVTFMPLFLADMSFSASQRGILLAIGPCVSMLTQTLWGGAADRAKNKVRIMQILACGLILVTTVFLASDSGLTDGIIQRTHGFLAGWLHLPVPDAVPAFLTEHRVTILITLGLMLYAFFQNPMLPMIDTISMEFLQVHRSPIKYGVIRTMGTFSFVVLAYVGGLIVERSTVGTKSIFYIYYIVLVCLLFALRFVPPVAGHPREKVRVSTLALFRDKWFTVMLTVAFVVSVAYGFNGSNFSNYLRTTLGASERVIGINTALGSVLEIFLFLIIHKIMKKTGIINLILICLTLASARWLVTGFVDSIPLLIVVQFFTQPFSWAILIYAIAVYIQKAIPDRLHARGQAVMNMVMSSVGRIVGSLAGGFWLQRLGAGGEPVIYRWLSLACWLALGAAVAFFYRFGWRIGREPEGLKLSEDTVI